MILPTRSTSWGPQLMRLGSATLDWTIRTLREAFVRVGYFVSSAVLLPYAFWQYVIERGSFSRIPVTIGILLLCVTTFLLYFSTTVRFRVRFLWRRLLLAALLFAILGVGFAAVLSIIVLSYLCEAINHGWERRGFTRLSFHPNLGAALVLVQALVVFPLLNDMYFPGTLVSIWHPDYNRQNVFYGINSDGFRGPIVPVERSHTPRLLFIGDSSPFGWPYRWEEAFPFLVKDILKARGLDVEVINAATIGQSDGEIRAQLPYYLKYQPDLVFMMTGIHYRRADQDYQRILAQGVSRQTGWRPRFAVPPMLVELLVFSIASSPVLAMQHKPSADRVAEEERELRSFEAQLRAVVQQIHDSGTHLYLVDYPTPGAERRVENVVRRVAQETGTDYIPLFDLIGNQIKSQLHDRTHPNREGHRLIAEEIATIAADALKAGTPSPAKRGRR